jgi:hypothetical protein
MTTPAHGAAMDWAASLVRRLDHMDRAAILGEWNGADGRAHRETLKISAPPILSQLVGYVRERLAQMPEEAKGDA